MTEEVDAKVDANVEEKPLVEEIPPADEVPEEEDPVASAPAVKVDDAEARAAASAAAAVAAKREFEDRQGETENQRAWREMHEKRAPEPKPAPPPEPEPVDVGDDVDGFMSAARFAGAKPGIRVQEGRPRAWVLRRQTKTETAIRLGTEGPSGGPFAEAEVDGAGRVVESGAEEREGDGARAGRFRRRG